MTLITWFDWPKALRAYVDDLIRFPGQTVIMMTCLKQHWLKYYMISCTNIHYSLSQKHNNIRYWSKKDSGYYGKGKQKQREKARIAKTSIKGNDKSKRWLSDLWNNHYISPWSYARRVAYKASVSRVDSLLLSFVDFTVHRHMAQPGWWADAGLVVDGGEKRRKALHDISDGGHCISRALSYFLKSAFQHNLHVDNSA